MFWRQAAISDHKNHEYIDECRQYVSDFIRTVIRKSGWFQVTSRALSIFVFFWPNDRDRVYQAHNWPNSPKKSNQVFLSRYTVHHGCFSSSVCCAENWIISLITEPYPWSFERHLNVVVIKRANSKSHAYVYK